MVFPERVSAHVPATAPLTGSEGTTVVNNADFVGNLYDCFILMLTESDL